MNNLIDMRTGVVRALIIAVALWAAGTARADSSRGFGEVVPAGPTFSSRVGMGIASTVAFEVVRQFGTNGYFDTQTLSRPGFWRSTLGSALGAAAGALVPGGASLKMAAALFGAGMGAGALSSDEQDWVRNVVVALSAAAGGVLLSGIPGGTFLGALLGQTIATYFLDKFRNVTHRTSGPILEGALSLLGVQGKDTASFRAHVEALPPRPSSFDAALANSPRPAEDARLGSGSSGGSGTGGSGTSSFTPVTVGADGVQRGGWSGTGTGSSGGTGSSSGGRSIYNSSTGTGTGSSNGGFR